MAQFLLLAENIMVGNLNLGTYQAETAEEAVQVMKDSDRQFSDPAKQQAKENGDTFLAYKIADSTQVKVDGQ